MAHEGLNRYEFEYKVSTQYSEIVQKITIEAASFEEAKTKFERAKQFVEDCEDSRVKMIEDWMLWDGWGEWIGCERCAIHGMYADCWGKTGCHGYYEGCGCTSCTMREEGV